jgi:plastocyanin
VDHAWFETLFRIGAALPGTRTSSTLAKFSVLLAGAALVATACAPATEPPNFPIATAGAKFVTFVPDSLNDAGRGASVAIDKDGRPVVSYLMLKAVLGPTDIPPAIKPGEPQPPAVMLTALSEEGLWTRTSVTPQLNSPKQGDEAKLLGDAPEISNEKGQPIAGVETALAIDGNGKRHVAWSTPTGVFYWTDANGSFGARETVTEQPGVGASVAVSADGTPWVSFITAKGAQLATKAGGAWTVQQVAGFSANLAGTAGLSTAIGVSGEDPLIAFGDGSNTMVVKEAVAGGGGVETVPGPGGIGVSMALDADGNPHVAYYDPNGGVHHAHSLGGAPWTVSDLGTVQAGANNQADQAGWATGIALDEKGVHYVTWADTERGEIELATNAGGQFEASPVPSSQGGLTPSIAVSEDSKNLAVAWFDSVNKNLDVSTVASGTTLALAFSPSPPSSAAPSPSASGSAAPCEPETGTNLTITAPVGASASGFDKTCLGVVAGTAFTVTFKNDDTAVPHNWALFTDSSATTKLGGAPDAATFITGPDQTDYQVKALDPGQYYYRCDIHPTAMFGQFVVAK